MALTVAEIRAFTNKVQALEVGAQEIKDTFSQVMESEAAIKAELATQTKAELLPHSGISGRMSDKKGDLVRNVFNQLLLGFTPEGGFIWSPFGETYQVAIAREVEKWTDELIEQKRSGAGAPPAVCPVVPLPTIPKPATDEPLEPNYMELGKAWVQQNKPVWAETVIIAQLYEDQSDVMTDYFNGKCVKTVVLAWSKHTRDLFPEMRKAADLYPPTQHLGTGKGDFSIWVKPDPEEPRHRQQGRRFYVHEGEDSISTWATRAEAEAVALKHLQEDQSNQELLQQGKIEFYSPHFPHGYEIQGSEKDIENREKYSMGHGFYLGHSRYSGWQVSKSRLCGDVYAAIGRGDHILDQQPTTTRSSGSRSPRPVNLTEPDEPLNLPPGISTTIIPGVHTKKGHNIWTVQLSGRVDRPVFNSLCERAKQLGGYYSSFTRNGAIAGFVFQSEEAAKLFTNYQEPEEIEKGDRDVDGIHFTFGEHENQIFWETVQKDVKYILFQNHSERWWTIVAEKGDSLRMLNGKMNGEPDPLYASDELTSDEWLELLADFINSGEDPFSSSDGEDAEVAVAVNAEIC